MKCPSGPLSPVALFGPAPALCWLSLCVPRCPRVLRAIARSLIQGPERSHVPILAEELQWFVVKWLVAGRRVDHSYPLKI